MRVSGLRFSTILQKLTVSSAPSESLANLAPVAEFDRERASIRVATNLCEIRQGLVGETKLDRRKLEFDSCGPIPQTRLAGSSDISNP